MDMIIGVLGCVLGIFGMAVAITAETGRVTVAGVVMLAAGWALVFMARVL